MARPKSKSSKRLSSEEEFEVIESMNFSRKVSLDYRVKMKFKNQKQKDLFNKILDNRIVFVSGIAGTGKTMIALMAILECLKNPIYNIKKACISKVIVPASRDIGFLKGELDEKLAPYMTAYWANLNKLIGKEWSQVLKTMGIIQEEALNFMRGDTFGDYSGDGTPQGWVCILDEAQNCSIDEMKLFISRMGEGTKLIIIGDNDQKDVKIKNGEQSGLENAIDILQGIDGIGFVEFTEDDIVRDPFLIEIMKRYKKS